MSVSKWLPLNMQSGEKHVRPAVGLRRQIASGSLIHWSLEGPNWIMDSEVCACVLMCVSVWCDREGHVGWPYSVAPLPWPISFNQAARQAPPFLPRPLSIRPPAPTRVLHYAALPGHSLETSPEEATERGKRDGECSDFTKKEKKPLIPFLLRFLPSRFLEVITGLPKLYWRK